MRSIFDNVDYDKDVVPPIREHTDKWLASETDFFMIDPEKKRSSIFLYGPTGSGKTHIAYAIQKKLNSIYHETFCRFFNFTEMMADIMNKNIDVEEIAQLRGVLILDDLGARTPNDYVIDTLYRILNYRYEHMMPTFITSNVDVNGLAEIFGNRISSRIDRMCVTCRQGE